MSAPAPDFSAAFKAVGDVFGQVAAAFAAAGREFAKFIDSQHGVPTPVLCETCGIVRPRISHAEADALIALGEMRRPRRIACRTKGCTGHSAPLRDLWES